MKNGVLDKGFRTHKSSKPTKRIMISFPHETKESYSLENESSSPHSSQ